MPKNKIHISTYGGGCETVHVALSKEAYEWWEEHAVEHGDGDLETYISAWDDDEMEFEIPKFAEFRDGEFISDAPGMVDHYWRIGFDDARIEVEVNGVSIFTDPDDADNEFYSPPVDDVVIGEAVYKDEPDDETEIRCDTTWTSAEKATWQEFIDKKYMVTYESYEKGNFFDATFEIDEEFDKSKITVFTAEDWRTGADLIADITYDGEDLDNEGGDSTGKGIYVYLWKHGE
ncbi:hypothetical protein HOB87_10520 [Candidatus Woesearchaeota archaeon]|jgi:hypothetical protein|nr:hypothetical protein [Candidatus Woesearchaeota archaeon]